MELIVDILDETNENLDELMQLSDLSREDINLMLTLLFKKIRIVPKSEYERAIPEAEKLLLHHLKDVPYLALALALDCAIWSNEKRLKEQQKRVKVYNSVELLSQLTRHNSGT